jgi:hypothetical protein
MNGDYSVLRLSMAISPTWTENSHEVSVSKLGALAVFQLAVSGSPVNGKLTDPHVKIMLFPRAIKLLQNDKFEMPNEWETFPLLHYSWNTYVELIFTSEKKPYQVHFSYFR